MIAKQEGTEREECSRRRSTAGALCSGSGRDPRVVWTRRAKGLDCPHHHFHHHFLCYYSLSLPFQLTGRLLLYISRGSFFPTSRPALSLISPGVIVSSFAAFACIITSLHYIRSASGIAGYSVPPTRAIAIPPFRVAVSQLREIYYPLPSAPFDCLST